MLSHRFIGRALRITLLSVFMLHGGAGCLDEGGFEEQDDPSHNPATMCPFASACIQYQQSENQQCLPVFTPHGTLCDDANPETHGDVCNGQGGCVGSSLVCPAPAQCISSYQPAGGQCMPNYSIAGAICDDGNPSTPGDICDGAGGCQGKNVQCPTTTQCTPSYNVTGGVCVPQHLAAGTPCSDGNEQTSNDTCNGAGLCGGNVVNCPQPAECVAGYTQVNGSCTAHYSPSGSACDDNNASTFQDACNGAGTCKGVSCKSANVLFSNTSNNQVGHVKLSSPNESKPVQLGSQGGRVAWIKATLSATCENLAVELTAPSKYPNLCFDHSNSDPCAPMMVGGDFRWNCVSAIHWFHNGQNQTLSGYEECPTAQKPCAVLGGAGKELYVNGGTDLLTCTGQCKAFVANPNRSCKWGKYNVKL